MYVLTHKQIQTQAQTHTRTHTRMVVLKQLLVGEHCIVCACVPSLPPQPSQYKNLNMNSLSMCVGVVLADNSMYCWGANYEAQCGDGNPGTVIGDSPSDMGV